MHVVKAATNLNGRRMTAASLATELAERLRNGEATCALWVEASDDGSLRYGFATDRLRSDLEMAGLVRFLDDAVMHGELRSDD